MNQNSTLLGPPRKSSSGRSKYHQCSQIVLSASLELYHLKHYKDAVRVPRQPRSVEMTKVNCLWSLIHKCGSMFLLGKRIKYGCCGLLTHYSLGQNTYTFNFFVVVLNVACRKLDEISVGTNEHAHISI